MDKYQIKAIRVRSGLNRAEFARALGLSYWTLKSWELGHRKPSKAAVKMLEFHDRLNQIERS